MTRLKETKSMVEYRQVSHKWNNNIMSDNDFVIFFRRDSFITHRAFCDALAEESARSSANHHHHHQALLPPSSQPHLINTSTYDNHNNLQTQFSKNDITTALTRSSSPSSSGLRQGIHQILPSWLGGPPTSSTMDHHRQPHHLGHESPNPNPTPTSLGPTTSLLPGPAPSSHMSATALLQKAAQMGSTLSKTGSSILRTHTTTTTTSHVSAAITDPSVPQGHVTTTSHGFFLSPSFSFSSTTASDHHQFGVVGAGSFEEALIINGGILNNPSTKDANLLHDGDLLKTTDSGGGGGGSVGNEGLTRDFLGLKPLFHNDILSMAGIGNCMSSSSSSHHDQPIRQFQWQA